MWEHQPGLWCTHAQGLGLVTCWVSTHHHIITWSHPTGIQLAPPRLGTPGVGAGGRGHGLRDCHGTSVQISIRHIASDSISQTTAQPSNVPGQSGRGAEHAHVVPAAHPAGAGRTQDLTAFYVQLCRKSLWWKQGGMRVGEEQSPWERDPAREELMAQFPLDQIIFNFSINFH